MIELGDYVACIVEGSAERAIIDVLLDNQFPCFSPFSIGSREVV